jgi:hypothetical protein
MAFNREKLFPDPAQRDLQDAADALLTAAEKMSYAARKVPPDLTRLFELVDECERLAHGVGAQTLRLS